MKSWFVPMFLVMLLYSGSQATLALNHNDDEHWVPTPPHLGEQHKEKFPGMGSYDAWKSCLPEFSSGMELMHNKQWDQAIAKFRAVLALYPYEYRAWLQIGKCIEGKGGLIADQEDAYRQALKLNTNSWQAWKRLANVLYTQRRYEEARQSLTNALNLNVPQAQRAEMDNMLRMIDSAQNNSDTRAM